MKYHLRDLFSDVIEAAKEIGIWQTSSLIEREEIVKYFLLHFDSLMTEARWMKFSHMMTLQAVDGRTSKRA
jgi:methionine synthase II (cobalamin-independent)